MVEFVRPGPGLRKRRKVESKAGEGEQVQVVRYSCVLILFKFCLVCCRLKRLH